MSQQWKQEVLAAFVANTLRSARFGAADPTGVANILVYNYLLQNKAIIWNASGRYSIDYDKTWSALETLGAEILRIQAHGDIDAAKACIDQYGIAGQESQSDKRVLIAVFGYARSPTGPRTPFTFCHT